MLAKSSDNKSSMKMKYMDEMRKNKVSPNLLTKIIVIQSYFQVIFLL